MKETIASMANTETSGYTGSDITVLEGLDAVRLRPGMYIGSTGPSGLHHLLWEVVDNSVDEVMADYADTVTVTLNPDNSVTVEDNGRGIPVDPHPTGPPTVEVVLTKLHAGGKFGGGAYTVSGGLHGVGISVVNALSSRIDLTIRRDQHLWQQQYKYAVPGPLEKVRRVRGTGTTVQFWPDSNIFETIEFDSDVVRRRLRELAYLNQGLTINFTDARRPGAEQEVYNFPGGIADYVDALSTRHKPVHRTTITASGTDVDTGYMVDVAMRWCESSSPNVHTYANRINTHEGGTHDEGFRAALTTAVAKYARDHDYLKAKNSPTLAGEDVREGLTAIVSVKLADPQFEGQTKTKLGNTTMKGAAQRVVYDALTRWLDSHPQEAKSIVGKAITSAKARAAAKQARDLVRKKGSSASSGLPGTLANCRSRTPAECELYLVEGNSAGGNAKTGRDSRTQAILPLRGKVLNTEDVAIGTMLKNNEINAIITSLGTGIRDDFDIKKLRYHKIILMGDADVDGHHISILLLTFLYRHMTELVEAGYVYIANPPLFKLKWARGAVEYAYSDAERDKLLARGRTKGRTVHSDTVQRYKGLGEMNAQELWETTMDPSQRTLYRVRVEDAASADALFSDLMGNDPAARLAYITRNSDAADIELDI